MRPARPRLTLAIERWLDDYYAWSDEHWFGLFDPRVFAAFMVFWCWSVYPQLFEWTAAVFVFTIVLRWLSRRRQLRVFQLIEQRICTECGYDLRASPERCPECGTPVPFPNLRRAESSSSIKTGWIGRKPDDVSAAHPGTGAPSVSCGTPHASSNERVSADRVRSAGDLNSCPAGKLTGEAPVPR
jgi:hypothetical protein